MLASEPPRHHFTPLVSDHGSSNLPYDIDKKLVVAVASSALFDLTESDRIFREVGLEEYREHQRASQDRPLDPGPAFPFIRRLLSLNAIDIQNPPVEVVLLSRNDPDTGLRVFNSIRHHALSISRGAFLNGKAPHAYMESFNASLLLSGNPANVREAVAAGQPAGLILGAPAGDDLTDVELRVAFDFDGILADDEAEIVFHATNDLNAFHAAETAKLGTPLKPGPLNKLFRQLSQLQDKIPVSEKPAGLPSVRIAVITARNAPSDARFVTTMREWGVTPDETFFLGGIEKRRVLKAFRPHMFFDDQVGHLESGTLYGAMVHVPFGVRNTASG